MSPGGKSKPVLVCLVGIDGSGKTTLAKGLVQMLCAHGVEASYLWGGFAGFTLLGPLVALVKAIVIDYERDMEHVEIKGRVPKSGFVSRVYHGLLLFDYVLQAFFRIRLPLAFGRSVICDRYIYDLTTTIGVVLDYSADRTLSLLDRCLTFLPKPDLVYLVDLPEALAYERKDDIVSIDFLSVRRGVFLQMARQHGMAILDGEAEPRQLEELVVEDVLQYMEGQS